jgi:hypothetical protein
MRSGGLCYPLPHLSRLAGRASATLEDTIP